MSATAKTLGSLGAALVGLVIYLGLFVGLARFDISIFGAVLYLGLALTLTGLVLVLVLTLADAEVSDVS